MSEQPLADRFVLGFVGTPGRRTFFIEIDDSGRTQWYLVEKAQVAAFAAEGAALLADLGLAGSGDDIDLGEVREPADVEFRVGQITMIVNTARDRVDVTLESVEADHPAAVHAISGAQLDAAVRVARDAVAKGRAACPLCGLAMDPEGHACPTSNGDLRNYQP